MKKLITLVVAACMVLGSLGAAAAVDVKVNGQWWFWYGYASNPLLVKQAETGKHADRIRARQRTRVQIQFIADENLSALLNLENNIHWGDTSKGSDGPANSYGAINADNSTFVIKRAHLDWTIPNTQVKTRMGIQGINLPGASIWNPVMNADVAGISVSAQFTPELGLTGFWARPYDRTYYDVRQQNGQNDMDDMDVFGFMLPIKTDVVRATPWAMFAFIGRDSGYYNVNGGYNQGSLGHAARGNDSQGYGWWVGTTFELPILDPFFVKLDAMYGKVDTGKSDYDMSGWMVAGDIGYKFSWGSLSALGFYSSGNKGDDDYGQLPIISADGAFNMSNNALYGLAGAAGRRWDGYLSNTGQGMWGMGLKVGDVSFVDNLKHTLTAMWYGGTNDGESVLRRTPRAAANNTFSERQLSTSDHAWEINLVNEYKVNNNLSFRLDVAYIQLELGDSWNDKEDTKGNFITGIGVQYMF